MKPAEYGRHDATALAEMIRNGDVSQREVASAALTAAEALNPSLNAILECHYDRADALPDTPAPLENAAVFAGVPMMLKDIGASEEGRKQELASTAFLGRVAPTTSDLTHRFRAAGLVNLGRTALPELGMASLNSVSAVNPSTVNPWNTDYMAGSSSGGAGAVVASGIVPIGHASDIGGSTRHPAGICGAVGLKTTRGRIPLGPEFCDYPIGTLNEFTITRSVRDSAALLDAVEGPVGGDPRTVAEPPQPFARTVREAQDRGTLAARDRPLRVALCGLSLTPLPLDPEVEATTRRVASVLATHGAEVEEAAPDIDFDAMVRDDMMCAGSFLTVAIRGLAEKEGFALDEGSFSKIVRDLMALASAGSAVDLFAALEGYNAVRRRIYDFFRPYDLLITPVMSCQTEKAELFLPENSEILGDAWTHHLQYLLPFNISRNPAMSVPAAMSSSGLPIGVQIAAPLGDDATLFAVAAVLQSEIKWPSRISPLP
ncbi:MAG: amidase, partial [Tateyamaria sp.]